MTATPDKPLYDVAIVGLGPVGCTAAILLAEAGLSVVAIERDVDVYALPRAVNLDGEIIRALQKTGRGQVVQELMQAVRPGDRAGFANSRREWLFGQKSREFGRNGWQPGNMFDQPELESYLRTEAVGQDKVDAHIGFELCDFEQHSQSVELTFQKPGEALKRVSASYLIACDGASSSVRKALGIGWVDLGYNHDWLVVDVTVKPGHTLDTSTVQVCDPDRIHTYVATKDPYRRWEFKLLPGETAEDMQQPEKMRALIDPWTPSHTYDIRRSAVYQFHAANAERWREGRVFIAGDAAHQSPPFLGQGMNAGMRDVVNLAWKLPMVLSGMSEDTLLDTYFEEREPHAHDLVDWAVSIGQLMEHIADQERCARAGLDPPQTPEHLASSGYGQGREQPPIRSGVVMHRQVSDDGYTGHLFRQPIVRRPGADNKQADVRLDEVLGPGFALISREDQLPDIGTEAASILERLGARVVTLGQYELVRGRFDAVFEEHDVALVRPDRLIFGHTDAEVTADELVKTLSSKLALANQ